MTPRIITADVARELLTAAPEGPYEACHPDDLPGRSVVVGGTEIRAPFDAFVVAIEDRERVSIANLLAAAPDLAHTVVAQAAEIERLRSALTPEFVDVRINETLRAEVEHLTHALAAASAIIDGRTTPPTEAEIAAHEATAGRWRCVVPTALHLCADAMHGVAARVHRDYLIATGHASLWWATDGRARPCAWPVVAEASR